jgi:hypothetical protein
MDLYNKTVRAAKKHFFQNELIKHQSYIKQTWAIIKMAINKSSADIMQNEIVCILIIRGINFRILIIRRMKMPVV